jgi:hypothetical protein
VIADPRDPLRLVHRLPQILRARILAIGAGAAMPRRCIGPSTGRSRGAPVPASRPPPLGLDIRYVVTSLAAGSAEHIYDTLYCARGQAENLIKIRKGQLTSDRTSCRSPIRCASFTSRDAIPKAHALAKAGFATIRLRLKAWRTGDRDRITHSPRLRCRSGGRSHQASRHDHQSRRTVKAGAVAAPRRTILETHKASQKGRSTTR